MTKEQTEKKRWVDERELRTTATPRQVWEAWTNPEHISRWFADEAEGEAVAGKELVHRFRDFGTCTYKVLESDPPHYLKLEGAWFTPFMQEIRIDQEGGDTVLRLIHSGFGDDAEWGDEYAGIDSGWQMAFAVLRHYLENHFGQPRTGLTLMRPSQFEYPELFPHYREEARLRQWLTASGRIGDPGDVCRLELRNGSTLTGCVLAVTGRELVVSWDEIDGVLEFKAFDMGPERRMVCLRACGWGPRARALEPLRNDLESSLERLTTVLTGSS